MTGRQPHSDPVLTKDLWQIPFTQAHLFATRYINRLRWRGAFGGVLPDGQDAESIAAQAVTDLFRNTRGRISLNRRSTYSKLSRHVWRIVDRLHHRNENLLLRNEPDLVRVHIDDGHVCRLVETIPGLGANPLDNLLSTETTTEHETLEIRFDRFLGQEQRLKSLFTCYANGIWQPRLVAPRLNLSLTATKNLQKRLKRRFQKFLEQSGAV